VEESPPTGLPSYDSSSRQPSAEDGPPPAPPARTPTPIKKTSSDVATAHAELDSVLPPAAPESGAAAAGEPLADPVAPVVPEPESAGPGPQTVAAPATVAEVKLEVPPPATPPTQDADAGETLPEVAEVEVALDGEGAQAASGNPLPRVLAVANQKGGVGKTTTSVNLGAALAELGFRVLVIDLDPQGNATTGLGIDARNFELSMYDVMMRDASLEDAVEPTSMKNLFVAPATIALAGAEIELVPAFSRELKLKRAIESVLDDFDYVLIDCPPSLGLITVNALAAADEVLVPIQCEYYALEGLSQLMRNVHLVASNLNPQLDISTIVLTMYDARTKLADQVANEVRLHFGSKVCRSVIPRTVRLSEAPSFGQPITAFDPTSRGAIAYRELAKEVSGGAS
jgi:chromosome partitioning protein